MILDSIYNNKYLKQNTQNTTKMQLTKTQVLALFLSTASA